LNIMMRVRLKADGRLVEIGSDGSERTIVLDGGGPPVPAAIEAAHPVLADVPDATIATTVVSAPVDAAYARGVRARTRLTQAEFAARIGVPIETVRNWEQGKRSPRGPARALLKVIERAPDVAFAALSRAQPER
jgi:putative transcriptional regulator